MLGHSFGAKVAFTAADWSVRELLGVDVSGCGRRLAVHPGLVGCEADLGLRRLNWGPLCLYPVETFQVSQPWCRAGRGRGSHPAGSVAGSGGALLTVAPRRGRGRRRVPPDSSWSGQRCPARRPAGQPPAGRPALSRPWSHRRVGSPQRAGRHPIGPSTPGEHCEPGVDLDFFLAYQEQRVGQPFALLGRRAISHCPRRRH